VPEIVIYTRAWCPYCRRAKMLLERKGVDYDEIDIEREPELGREMIHRAGGRSTVPQIFIGDKHIGGSDDLYALERAGRLNEILGSPE
jgi:glutaredoxin 3